MSLESNKELLMRMSRNPALPVIGFAIYQLLEPLNSFLMALDRLFRSFSSGATLTDHLFYWPSELVEDVVENFFSLACSIALALLFLCLPYLIASALDANKTIMNLAFWVPMVFGASFLLGVSSEWVVGKAEKLMASPLAKGSAASIRKAQAPVVSVATREIKKTPQAKQKFIL